MIRHEVTLHLNRPVEQVFSYLADSQNLRAWQSNLVENEQLTEGPVHNGTRFREVRRMGPRQSEIQAEITDWEPNKSFGTRTLTPPEVTIRYSLEREAGGTRLRYQFAMVTRGLMRLLEPVVAGSIRKETESDFAELKRLLEG